MSETTTSVAAAGPEPVLLDYRGAAKALAIGQRTLADLVAKGEIPVVRIGVRVLFRPSALAAWSAEKEATGEAAAGE